MAQKSDLLKLKVIFNKIDKNKNGKLSIDELVEGLADEDLF